MRSPAVFTTLNFVLLPAKNLQIVHRVATADSEVFEPNQHKGVVIVGDKGYSSHATRQWPKRRSIADVIPTRSNEWPHLNIDRPTYRIRNIIERSIGWLKESRRVANRHDKLISSYLTFITLASIRKMMKLI